MIVIPARRGCESQVDFAWAPPAPGSNIRGDDHFCLLVRLENESDPSQIGVGGWSAITAQQQYRSQERARSARRSGRRDHELLRRRLVGSGQPDRLPEPGGRDDELILPVQALPWRDIKLIERHRRRAAVAGPPSDPLASTRRR